MDVVLHKRVERLPAKRLCQLGRADGLVRGLEVVEDALERKGERFRGNVLVGRDLVHGLAEVVGAVKRLKQRVHVAGCALVPQSDVSRLLLRIVAAVSAALVLSVLLALT